MVRHPSSSLHSFIHDSSMTIISTTVLNFTAIAIHTGPSRGGGRGGRKRNVAVPLCTKVFKGFLAREVIPCLKTREVREAWEGFIEL